MYSIIYIYMILLHVIIRLTNHNFIYFSIYVLGHSYYNGIRWLFLQYLYVLLLRECLGFLQALNCWAHAVLNTEPVFCA